MVYFLLIIAKGDGSLPKAPAASSYDLFLSYNSADHSIVEEVAHKLADAGLKELFLDRWNLLIGTRWRPMLEKALGLQQSCGNWAVLRESRP